MSTPLRRSLSQDQESGYDSAGSASLDTLQTVYFTAPHLKYINSQLQELEPEGRIRRMSVDSSTL